MLAGIAGSNPAEGMDVRLFEFVVCCVGIIFCDCLITRAEESYRALVRVCMCDLETSTVRRSMPESRCGPTDNTSLHKFLLMLILTLESKSLILLTSVRVDDAFDSSPVEVPNSK